MVDSCTESIRAISAKVRPSRKYAASTNRSPAGNADRASSVADSRRGSTTDIGSGTGVAELAPFLVFLFKTPHPLLPAIAIDLFLRHHSPQPTFQRAAASIGRELGNSP